MWILIAILALTLSMTMFTGCTPRQFISETGMDSKEL
jgi:hypothetical protein